MAKLDSINPEADKKFEERERKKRGLPKKGEFTKKKKKRRKRKNQRELKQKLPKDEGLITPPKKLSPAGKFQIGARFTQNGVVYQRLPDGGFIRVGFERTEAGTAAQRIRNTRLEAQRRIVKKVKADERVTAQDLFESIAGERKVRFTPKNVALLRNEIQKDIRRKSIKEYNLARLRASIEKAKESQSRITPEQLAELKKPLAQRKREAELRLFTAKKQQAKKVISKIPGRGAANIALQQPKTIIGKYLKREANWYRKVWGGTEREYNKIIKIAEEETANSKDLLLKLSKEPSLGVIGVPFALIGAWAKFGETVHEGALIAWQNRDGKKAKQYLKKTYTQPFKTLAQQNFLSKTLTDPWLYLYAFAAASPGYGFTAIPRLFTGKFSKLTTAQRANKVFYNTKTRRFTIFDYLGKAVKTIKASPKAKITPSTVARKYNFFIRELARKGALNIGKKGSFRIRAIPTPKKSLKQRKPISKAEKRQRKKQTLQEKQKPFTEITKKIEITKPRQTQQPKPTDRLNIKQLRQLYVALTGKRAPALKKSSLKRTLNRILATKPQGGTKFVNVFLAKKGAPRTRTLVDARQIIPLGKKQKITIQTGIVQKVLTKNKGLGKRPKEVKTKIPKTRGAKYFTKTLKQGDKGAIYVINKGSKTTTKEVTYFLIEGKQVFKLPRPSQKIKQELALKRYSARTEKQILKEIKNLQKQFSKDVKTKSGFQQRGGQSADFKRAERFAQKLQELGQKARARRQVMVIQKGKTKEVVIFKGVKKKTIKRKIQPKAQETVQSQYFIDIEFTTVTKPIKLNEPAYTPTGAATLKLANGKTRFAGKDLRMIKIGQTYVLRSPLAIARAIISKFKVINAKALKSLLRGKAKLGLFISSKGALATVTRSKLISAIKAIQDTKQKQKQELGLKRKTKPSKLKIPAKVKIRIKPPRKTRLKTPKRPTEPKRPKRPLIPKKPKKPKKPIPPPKIPPKIKLPKLPKVKKFDPNKPYNVYVKRRNSWVKFGKPVKGSDAIRLGRWVVNNHIAATYVIRRSTAKKVTKIAKRLTAPAKGFRTPKKTSRLPKLAEVEKRAFRLNTRGETRQITLAKLQKTAFPKKKAKKRVVRRKK